MNKPKRKLRPHILASLIVVIAMPVWLTIQAWFGIPWEDRTTSDRLSMIACGVAFLMCTCVLLSEILTRRMQMAEQEEPKNYRINGHN